MYLTLSTYKQKPNYIDVTRFINKKGYLDQYMYYRDHILKTNSFDLLKNTLIQTMNLEINKSMFKLKTNEHLFNQNQISKQEFKGIKAKFSSIIKSYTTDIQQMSKLTPLEFLKLPSTTTTLIGEINHILFTLIKPDIEPLYDLKKEDKVFSVNSKVELETAFKSILNIKSLKVGETYLITPNDIDALNTVIKQHSNIIPKKINELPIQQFYLKNNEYYLLSAY